MKKLIALFALTLTGCAHHLNQEQCLSTNWHQVGVQDGERGAHPRDLSGAIEDCQKFNLAVNTKGYLQGWKQGVKQYCKPDFSLGLEDGKAGKPLSMIENREGICAEANISLTLNEYKRGRSVGLKSFCTYDNGASLARRGQALPDVCEGSLKNEFNKGWKTAAHDYCAQIKNAFALGRSNQPYPATCPADEFPAFRMEYDRGYAVGIRIKGLQARIADLDRDIERMADHYRYKRDDNGYKSYRLGHNQTPEAVEHLNDVRNELRMKRDLEMQLFYLQEAK